MSSRDWSWYSHGGLIPGKFDLKVNRSMKTPDRNIVQLCAPTHRLLIHLIIYTKEIKVPYNKDKNLNLL